MARAVDAALQDWSSLQGAEWPVLVVGNGLSINLWRNFGYPSLFKSATLSAPARAIFTELKTTNFEHCLECLYHARIVLRALKEPTAKVDQTYAAVRDALFEAIGRVHVPWEQFPSSTHVELAANLNMYEAVFTTNYDLCLYWSHMQESASVDMVDFFWQSGSRFDPADTDVRGIHTTRIYYLHGGIHLWQDDQTGENGKWTRKEGRLLDIQVKYGPGNVRRPLFVSEGNSTAKMRTIRQSPYLSFCLDELRNDARPTVIFGHSLSEQDAHVVSALNEGAPRRFAVSIFPAGPDTEIIAEKVRVMHALSRHTVEFFDSTTHPLGDPQLLISGP